MAVGTRSLWRDRDFLLLWSGQSVSEVGSQVTQVAIPLLALLTLNATTFEVALLTAANGAAFLLVALHAGALVDRVRKKPVLVAADVGRCLLLASIPVAQALGVLTLAQLYAVALLGSVLTVFFDVSYQSYLPHLVPTEALVEGNGKLAASAESARFVGPPVGGLGVGALGAAYAVIVDAVSFAVSVVCTACVRDHEPAPPPAVPGRRMRTEIREGLSFVVRHPVLSRIVGCTGTANFFGSAGTALEAVFVVRDLGASPFVFGLVSGLAAIGGIAGAASSGAIARRIGSARTIWLSISLSAPFLFLAPLGFSGWGVSLVAVSWAGTSFIAVVYNTSQVSYRQAVCPPALLGRMNASVRFIVWGTIPLGALAGGSLATLVGARTTLAVAAVGGSLAALWVVRSPLFGLRDVPIEPVPPEPVLTEPAPTEPAPTEPAPTEPAVTAH